MKPFATRQELDKHLDISQEDKNYEQWMKKAIPEIMGSEEATDSIAFWLSRAKMSSADLVTCVIAAFSEGLSNGLIIGAARAGQQQEEE